HHGVPLTHDYAFDIHEQAPGIGRAGWLPHADDREGVVQRAVLVGNAVLRAELVAGLQTGLPGHDRPDHGLQEMLRLLVVAMDVLALREAVTLSLSVFDVEHPRGRRDHAEASAIGFVTVPQA